MKKKIECITANISAIRQLHVPPTNFLPLAAKQEPDAELLEIQTWFHGS